MAFGVTGACFDCIYLKPNDTSGSKVWCEYHKAYIEPDVKGCGRHVKKD